MADETTNGAQAPQQLSIEERIGAFMNPEANDGEAGRDTGSATSDAGGDEGDQRDAAPDTSAAPDDQSAAPDADGGGSETGGGEADESLETETVEITDLDGLAEHLGIEVADLYEVEMPVNINGKRELVKLGQYKDSVAAMAEADKIRDDAKQLREQMAQQYQQQAQAHAQSLAEAQALVKRMEDEAVARFENVPWEQLRAENPSEWAAQRRELDEVNSRLTQAKAEINQKAQQAQQQNLQQQQMWLNQQRQKEYEALTAAWPEMADPEKAESERTKLIGFLSKAGFSDQEIGNAVDHRIILMARDAMRWRDQDKKVAVTKKKVARIAKKVLRPGAKQSKAEQQDDQIQGLRKQAKKTGHVDDAAALISRLNQR